MYHINNFLILFRLRDTADIVQPLAHASHYKGEVIMGNTTNLQALTAYNAIVKSFVSGEDMPVNEVNLLIASIKDLQVRDYVLGHAPMTLTAKGAVALIEAILPLIEEGERAPFYTLLSAFYYEVGDKELAYVSIVQAQLLNPDYSLAKLLDRVYKAGWPSDEIATMRESLHPKVAKDFEVERELELA